MGKHTDRNKRRRNAKNNQHPKKESPEKGISNAQVKLGEGRALPLGGIRATFVAAKGPSGSLPPAEALAKIGAAIARVISGEPAFRIGKYVGVVLSVTEWAPIVAAMGESISTKIEEEKRGRPKPRSSLKGANGP